MLRLLSYFVAAFLTIIVSIIAIVGLFLFFQGNVIETAIIGGIATIFIAIIFGFIGFQMTGQNPWVKTIQGEAMLLLGFSSGGVGQVFSCTTKNNPSGGIDLVTNMNKQEVSMAYDKKMAFRFLKPLTAFSRLLHPGEKVEGAVNAKPEDEQKARTLITIPNEDFDKHAFHFGYITVLFFNFETGTLINKFDVNTLEKFFQMKYLSLHSDRKYDMYAAELRQARKNFLDALLSRLSSFMKSPAFPVLVLIVVALFGIVFLIIAFPGLGDFVGKILPHAPAAASNTAAGLPPAMTHLDTNAAIRKI